MNKKTIALINTPTFEDKIDSLFSDNNFLTKLQRKDFGAHLRLRDEISLFVTSVISNKFVDIKRVWIFGSVAEGDASPSSDIDLIVAVGDNQSIALVTDFIQRLDEYLVSKFNAVMQGSVELDYLIDVSKKIMDSQEIKKGEQFASRINSRYYAPARMLFNRDAK